MNMRSVSCVSVLRAGRDSDSDALYKTQPLHIQRRHHRRQGCSQKFIWGRGGEGSVFPLPFSFPSSIPFSHKIQLDFASVVTYVNPKRGQGRNPGRNGPFGVFRAGNACSGCKCSISVEQNPKIEILRDKFYFGEF